MPEERGFGDRLVTGAVPLLGAAWLRLCRATMRLRRHGVATALPEDGGPVIYCFWHAQLAMMPWVQLRPPSVVPISRSRDGEMTARLFARLDVEAVRGSSSRAGSAAARGLLRAAARGQDMAITPDGPRGPARRIQPGAVWLGRATGRPLLPVAFAARPALRLPTWDRMLFPVPLCKGIFVYGEHLWVERDLDGEALAAVEARLTAGLDEVSERAAELL